MTSNPKLKPDEVWPLRRPGRDGRRGVSTAASTAGCRTRSSARSSTSWPGRRTGTRPSWSGSSATSSPAGSSSSPTAGRQAAQCSAAVDDDTAVLDLFKLAMQQGKGSRGVLQGRQGRRSRTTARASGSSSTWPGSSAATTSCSSPRSTCSSASPTTTTSRMPTSARTSSTSGPDRPSARRRTMEPAKDRIAEDHPGPAARSIRDPQTVRCHYETPFQILVATILSAQCTDERVNKVTPGLFRKYPDDPAPSPGRPGRARAGRSARPGSSATRPRTSSARRRRSSRISAAEVPATMEELLTLPGVARKTANIVLSSAFGKAEGIAVDTHVRRLSGRLGLSRKTDPTRSSRTCWSSSRRSTGSISTTCSSTTAGPSARPGSPQCGMLPVCKLCPSAGKVSRRGIPARRNRPR